MITLFILFDFLNSLSHFQMALLGLVPLFLVIATLLLNIFLRRKETAGFVCNGSVLMMWYFVIYLASVFAQYSVKWLPKDWVGKDSIFDTVHKDGVPDNSILWYLLAATIAYFVCYFFIAFRPVTAEQLQWAKTKKKIVLEMSSEAVAHALKSGAMTAAGALWTIITTLVTAALSGLFMLLFGFLGALALGVFLLPILGGVALFGTLFLMFASILIVWVLCVWKFLKNTLVVLSGPDKIAYRPKGDDD
jgi:hypothetical protein